MGFIANTYLNLQQANRQPVKAASIDRDDATEQFAQIVRRRVSIDNYVRYIQFSHTLTSLLHYLQDRSKI